MVGGQQPQAHHGGHHGNACAAGQLQKLFLGAGAEDSSSRADKGPAGAFNGLGHPLDLKVVTLDAGLISSDIHRLREFGFGNELLLDIDGNIDQNGAFASCGRDVKGFFHDPGDIVCVLDQIAVLDKRGAGPGYVHLLEDIPSEQEALYLPGNGNQGNAVHIGRGDPGDEVCGPRAGSHHANARLPTDACIARRHVSRVLFRANQRIMNSGSGYRVHRRADGGARISENLSNAFPQQALNQYLCSVCHTHSPPLGYKQKDLVRLGRSLTPWYHLNSR
ncbi:hypothetical protein SDC9_127963 [bioreactor metagenome]|uniref:Uncharacterized protein n=1 Tax=bioreactor metagenome TaxID=1076179 RepID=A0A645CW38_9ZZZZ